MNKFFEFCVVALAMAAVNGAAADVSLPAQDRELVHQLFQQLIEINTTHSVGSVTKAAEAMRQRLLGAGFPAADLLLSGPTESKQNLIARYRGSGKARPVVILSHLDVVEAQPSEWATDPFRLIQKNGSACANKRPRM